jgi:hypothetical protein
LRIARTESFARYSAIKLNTRLVNVNLVTLACILQARIKPYRSNSADVFYIRSYFAQAKLKGAIDKGKLTKCGNLFISRY